MNIKYLISVLMKQAVYWVIEQRLIKQLESEALSFKDTVLSIEKDGVVVLI